MPLHCPSPTAALRGGGSPEPTNPLVIALQRIIPLNQDSSLRPGTYVTNTALRAVSLPRDACQALLKPSRYTFSSQMTVLLSYASNCPRPALFPLHLPHFLLTCLSCFSQGVFPATPSAQCFLVASWNLFLSGCFFTFILRNTPVPSPGPQPEPCLPR